LLPTPVFSVDTMSITSVVVSEKIMPMVRNIAYATGCEVINLYNLLIDSPQLFPDKVHPSKVGATLIAQRMNELVLMESDQSISLLGDLIQNTKPFNFYGFEGYDFTFKNRNAKIVTPK